MASPRLLFFAGSLRRDSLNKTLAQIAAGIAERHGASVTVIDMADYPLPVFNEDITSFPPEARALKALFAEHDGVFIASPEYNGHYSGMLKNVLDWMSRAVEKGEAPLASYAGKIIGMSSVSPGPLGGLRGLIALRALFGCLPVYVVPSQAAIGGGANAFDADGNVLNARAGAMLEQCVREMTTAATGLKTPSA